MAFISQNFPAQFLSLYIDNVPFLRLSLSIRTHESDGTAKRSSLITHRTGSRSNCRPALAPGRTLLMATIGTHFLRHTKPT